MRLEPRAPRTRRARRHRAVATAAVLCLLWMLPARAATAQGAGAAPLEQRMRAFLAAVHREGPDEVAAFFPRGGSWAYVHTAHRPEGERVGTWRFPAGETRRAVGHGGPLVNVFTVDYEAQPVGLLAHQVMHRGTAWIRVRGHRFVPPGASAGSAVFVEWRREDGEWVVSAVADESFTDVPLPGWCC